MRYAETGFNLEMDLLRGSLDKVETGPKIAPLYVGGLECSGRHLGW
jgi:hypothetical protein